VATDTWHLEGRSSVTERSTTTTRACCGRPTAEECRCYTDAEELAAAIRDFVARRVRNPHDVDDVTQEALLRLYRGAKSLRGEPALEGWMYQIARSALVDHYRRGAARPDPVDPEQADLQQHPGDSDEHNVEASLAGCLTPLLARLPDSYRAAIELTDLGDLTQDQAAAQLGLSTSGMKSRVQRGRRMLRDEVAKCCRIELDARGALSDATRRDSGSC
jgi:RNA polymerase sigma-70 factor (ECF subfamily)